ncbi:kinase-like domain-containing protein [Auriculariales sp. MPI-PUGE-AT-0066]|nr:kinase-like domain-containing protein [Auriculariales sp. MPI-PUGE-AT-0066]
MTEILQELSSNAIKVQQALAELAAERQIRRDLEVRVQRIEAESARNIETPTVQSQRDKPLHVELEALRPFIDLQTDPRQLFMDMTLVWDNKHEKVYSARRGARVFAVKIAPVHVEAQGTTDGKSMSPSPKIAMLKHELLYIGPMHNQHICSIQRIYLSGGEAEPSLWIESEFMGYSLAKLAWLLVDLHQYHRLSQFPIREQVVARFTADALAALTYLQKIGIAHRDIRGNNLLLNKDGIVKLVNFGHAAKRYKQEALMCRDIVGRTYWQAAEMHQGPYDAMKVDVWSLGATAWELFDSESSIGTATTFRERWPRNEIFRKPSQGLHDFLVACSEVPTRRLSAEELSKTPWIGSACSRSEIIDLMRSLQQWTDG